MWGGGIYKDNLERALFSNLDEQNLNNFAYIAKLKKDIIQSYLDFGATPEEYFAFEFENKTSKQRGEFLTNKVKDLTLMTMVRPELLSRLRDKYELYKLIPEYFKRDVCLVRSDNERKEYLEFVNTNTRYFVKELNGQCGRRATILSGNRFEWLLSQGQWIVEQLIVQDEVLAKFNTTSVNTVRVPAFLIDNNFHPIAPFFRTGRRGSIVDNGGAGGIFAAIDVQNGIIISDGYDENNRSYNEHPDSGIQFKGFKIPRWDELLEIASKVHKRLHENRYLAFDFALTNTGWCIVEVNGMGQFLWQYATKQGLKKEFLEYMNS